MTDTSTHPLTPDPPPPPPADRDRPGRLYQGLAWVGITAGVVFIVAVVFFSGFFLGKHSGSGHAKLGFKGREVHMIHRGGPPPMGPPGAFGPWAGPGAPMGPGGPGAPGGPGTPPSPTTTTPRP